MNAPKQPSRRSSKQNPPQTPDQVRDVIPNMTPQPDGTPNDQSFIRIPAHVFLAVHAIAPLRDARRYLNGVRVERAGNDVRLVACSGPALIVARVPSPGLPAFKPFTVFIASKSDRLLGACRDRESTHLGLDPVSRRWKVYAPGWSFYGEDSLMAAGDLNPSDVDGVDDCFPQYERVYPEPMGMSGLRHSKLIPGFMNAKALADFSAAAAYLQAPTIAIQSVGGGESAHVRFHDEPDVYGVLSCIRPKDGTEPLCTPDWALAAD